MAAFAPGHRGSLVLPAVDPQRALGRLLARWTRREWFVVCAITLVISAAFVALSPFGFDLLEEGYFVALARRVQLGSLPYRDFSTPYTPGVFYLYAWVLNLVGPGLLALRWLQILARAIYCLGLYLIGRRLMPPFFAALAPLLVLGADSAPDLWGLHPGWFSVAAASIGVLAFDAFICRRQARWLFAAGVAIGVSFLFKQNIAAFALAGALWFAVAYEARLSPLRGGFWSRVAASPALQFICGWRWFRVACLVAQAVTFCSPPIAAVLVTRQFLTGTVALLFIVPLCVLSLLAIAHAAMAAGVALVGREGAPGAPANRLRFTSLFARPLIVLAGFGLVTFPWLTLLLRSLDWRVSVLGELAGNVDLSGYRLDMPPLRPLGAAVTATLLASPLIVVCVRSNRKSIRCLSALGVGGVLSILVAGSYAAAVTPHYHWGAALPAWSPYTTQVDAGPVPAFLYLPTIIFWAAFVLAALPLGRVVGCTRFKVLRCTSSPRRSTETDRDTMLRLWHLVAGSLLLLDQYPRMDGMHLLWSGGILFVVGADLLNRWHTRLVGLAGGRTLWARWTLTSSLFALPALIVVPHMIQRAQGALDLAHKREVQLKPLNIDGKPVAMVDGEDATTLEQVAALIDASVAPGEPIFTYPAIPGFYYLADRPNATRFNHLFRGMASATDQAEIVAQLAAVRTIVWDDGGAHYWVHPGDNAPVTDYIAAHFRVERTIGLYTVLVRDDGATLPPAVSGAVR